MKRNALWMTAILLCLTVLSTSCRKRQHIEILKDHIAFNYLGGNDVFSIVADCDWTIEMDESIDWFTIDPTAGGSDSTFVVVTAEKNNAGYDRSAIVKVVSANKKVKKNIEIVQNWVDISAIEEKLWFLRYYTRWDTDYFNHVIPESCREYYYYTQEDMHNWYLYFVDDTMGYEVHIYPQKLDGERDTIFHEFEYVYYPLGDSLLISFETVSDTLVEEYHANINELNNDYFNFTNEYLWHRFEQLDMVNLNQRKTVFNIRPEKIKRKPAGRPLIDSE